ncbi:insulinase family protein [Vibrio sp. SCSIO 43137]|uniref:insulinase family protein n=1 Tax=Vibrio sp. SCSIO 43137 TaxID=3021011 RepID=UPI0023082062|nr:insulinase family protein [Vibrio sp. SCSIO 43137]WCE28939.1 insulinase family protein [Vibrio sp. SCSIO 43137]
MHLSPNDTNHYRYLTLDNGLRVLLVQDDHAQKAAAALAVNVGHFDDPADRQGLAHYLEHMLFLGTSKYPKIGEFQNFTSQHGGHNNAWTGTEHTCYFFDISPNAFEQALDRFSQFFNAPLFNPEALDKERQAVDSEYQLKLNDDTRRLYQVHKEVVNPKHPFSKFSVGNKETLADRNNSTIRQEIVQFYQQHYSADLMTLTLITPFVLDKQESWVLSRFASIQNKQLANKAISEPLLRPDDKSIYVSVEPVKETRKLIIAFQFPNMDNEYSSKPLSYFAHLIGAEGKGSLMLYLKEKGWITSLAAGGGISGSNFREFTVNINLTCEGINQRDEIISALFEYIELIRQQGFDEWRFREKQAVLESAFRFQEKARQMDLASHLVMNLQYYPQQDVIYGDYKMTDYNEEKLKSLIENLVPENARVTFIAKGQAYNQTSKWYFTPYSVEPFTEQQLQMWRNPKPNQELALPEKNPFICYELDPSEIERESQTPELIEELPGFRLWHLQETEFRVPKGVVYIAIDSPHAVSTARKIVKMRLCVEMFLDSLTQQTYPAEIAGMGYNLYAHQGGVTLSISGFSQKQPELLNMILEQFAAREFNQQRFNTIKNQMLRNWRNAAKDRPISQLFNAMTGILQPNNPPHPALIEALESIEVDELPSFVDAVIAELHIEMFVYGDWQRENALALANTLKDAMRVKNQQYEESLRPLVMLGNSGTYQREVLCNQDDSAIVVYYQSPDCEAKSIALYTLANHLMSASFFNQVRTKQQLGYMVGTGNMPLNRHPGLILYVQSPKAAPKELLSAIDEFLNAFYLVLLELSESQWNSSKQGLWNQIAAPDNNLRGRAQRFWVAIGNKDLTFDQREQVLDQINQLSRADMIRFVVNTLKPRTANRLIMHSRGNKHLDSAPLTEGNEIGSIDEFQLRPKDVELG